MNDYLKVLEKIKPRSIIYLFSGGKHSSLALLRTRDIVKKYEEERNNTVKVYIVYVYITGNTHPLNAYCAANIMFWHQKYYGFQPILLAREILFQECMYKYGLQLGPQRWCYVKFKEEPIMKVQLKLPRPQLVIDGMSPSDSKYRKNIIRSEFEEVTRRSNLKFTAWHPLFNYFGDPLQELKNYKEFECIVKLYEEYGDSLNCIICPYKTHKRYTKYAEKEDITIICDFILQNLRSKTHRKTFSRLASAKIVDYIS